MLLALLLIFSSCRQYGNKSEVEMKEELRNYMIEKQPIDIVLNVLNEKSNLTILKAFLIININDELNTFEGYTLEERNKSLDKRILSGDSISLINISKTFRR
jgi:hypothetical protein